jgi:hypothetical protein
VVLPLMDRGGVDVDVDDEEKETKEGKAGLLMI